ncbi:19078_t:CDS:1 [Cetraspora pellucida]|uniref:19078_t:CDS:1 n=1 Tax=Cetraspora pellucida TaxID=1433469 RepID=A0A9N9D836_9GLOM|nr:19078_t:CDS:1 [Cetraspora pellucida]
MFCRIDLQQEKCNCDLSNMPNRGNRTDTVKYAFTKIFNPNWIKEKVDFVQEKIEYYNYSLSSKEYFNFTLYARCNSNLLRLSSKAKKTKESTITDLEMNTYNFTILINETSEPEDKYYWRSNKKGYSKKELENYTDNEFLSDDEIEIEYTYGIFIKLENGMSLLAK